MAVAAQTGRLTKAPRKLLHLGMRLSFAFDIAASGFLVRSARAIDAKACRMLLPELGGRPYCLVALDGAQGLVVGAAGLAPQQRTTPLLGPGVMLHVIEPCRRHGIGGALCEELIKAARMHGAKAVYAARRVEIDSQEMRGWAALGFSVCETVEEHELPVGEFVPRLAPLVKRFRREGRIPADARIIPLHAADRAKVLQLHLDELGGNRGALYEKLRGQGVGAFHQRHSRVLVVGDRVVGCILVHLKSRHVAAVDADIVAQGFRGGWANVWLKLEATQGALSLGITHFHYTSFDHYADTRSFTAKLGGVTTRRWALLMREIE